jgi:IclR family transcriptional regulator, KDG regulon repressor
MRTDCSISVVEKSFRILESFRGERQVALRELADRARLVKSSTYRILFTLERLGYVEKNPGGRYSITSRLNTLTGRQQPSFDLIKLAEPFMVELQRQFGETVNLGVLDGGEVLYLRVLESSYALRTASHVGLRGQVHSTGLGKCLVSRLPRADIEALLRTHPLRPKTPRTIRDRVTFYRELQKVRTRGYAIDNEEDCPGARCVAAPLLDLEGRVSAAISISGPAARVNLKRDAETAKALKETCARISKLVGYPAS